MFFANANSRLNDGVIEGQELLAVIAKSDNFRIFVAAGKRLCILHFLSKKMVLSREILSSALRAKSSWADRQDQ
jgi:hypothetical protein